MRISCIQMNMQLGQPDRNFAHARELIERAVSEERPDTVVLPETWNTGFFPKDDLAALSDRDGDVQLDLVALPRKLSVFRARLALVVVAAAAVAAPAAGVGHVGEEPPVLRRLKKPIHLGVLFRFPCHRG